MEAAKNTKEHKEFYSFRMRLRLIWLILAGRYTRLENFASFAAKKEGTTMKGKNARKIARKKAKLEEKKLKLKTKLGKASALAVLLAALAGCQNADPTTRSGSSTYGDIIMSDCTNCTLTIGDGVLLDATGDGNSNNTPSQETSPSLTLPGDAISTGIAVAGNLAAKAITSSGNSGSSGTPASSGSVDCTDGSCIPATPSN